MGLKHEDMKHEEVGRRDGEIRMTNDESNLKFE